MSLFHCRLHPIAARGRACYSFFSNKAGGRRSFSAPKPPKSVGSPTTTSKDPSPSSETSSGDGLNTNTTCSSPGASPSNPAADHKIMQVSDQPSSSSSKPSSSHDSSDAQKIAGTTSELSPAPAFPLYHPPIDSKGFKLHQFFSLHRPLLLVSHPTSTLFDQPASLPPTNPFASLFSTTDPDTSGPPVLPATIDNPPEASPEADADAARHLARALVMNRVSGTVEWEATLRRLGIDVSLEEDRAVSKVQCDKEWKDIMMESTKRKRRSKMKKHKYVAAFGSMLLCLTENDLVVHQVEETAPGDTLTTA